MKKKWITKTQVQTIKLVFLLLFIAVVSAATSVRNNARLLTETPIVFENPDQPLISEKTVNKLLIQNKDSVKNIAKETLNLKALETRLLANPYIRNANVYVAVDGEVGVYIEQKTPLARVQTSEDYYIDEQGKRMPISSNFSVRVPLVTGTVTKKTLPDVFALVKSITNDVFFKKQITGIVVSDKKYMLLLREFNFVVDFGTTQQMKTKLNNFKAFYKKALKDSTINTYKRVNLQIASQVICTKK